MPSGLSDREPCPWRIVDDIGGAFCMGCIGGGVWHLAKGSLTSRGVGRILGAVAACQARSPILGGQFAVWGGLFACCDCTISFYRQKEDPWNSIISGGVTGGILAARSGPRSMATAAVFGAVILALIEGFGIWMSRHFAPPVPTAEDYELAYRQQQEQEQQQQQQQQQGLSASLQSASTWQWILPSSSSPSSSSTTTTIDDPYSMDGSTIFSTEGSSSSNTEQTSSSNSSWWPFGGSSSSNR